MFSDYKFRHESESDDDDSSDVEGRISAFLIKQGITVECSKDAITTSLAQVLGKRRAPVQLAKLDFEMRYKMMNELSDSWDNCETMSAQVSDTSANDSTNSFDTP